MAVLQESDSYAVKFLNSFGIDERQLLEELVNESSRGNADDKYSGKKGKNGKSKTPTLDEFGRDLTALAKDGKIDPVIGREKEIERVIQILSRASILAATKSAPPLRLDTLFDPNQRSAVIVKRNAHASGQSAIVALSPRLVNCCASDWIDPANDC